MTLQTTPFDDDAPTCPDCGSAAQGTGFFGNPYCGLCEKSIYLRIPTLTPLTTTARQLDPDAWAYARMEDTFSAPLNQITGRVA